MDNPLQPPDSVGGTDAPLRLLIVAYHFPPADSVGARRPAALARYAAERQWDVRVLTTGTPDLENPVPEVPERHIVRVAPVPRLPRLRRSPAAAADGADATASRPATAARTRAADLRLAVNRWVWKAGSELLVPDSQVNWIWPAVRRFLDTRDGWRPDVILATGPPFSVFAVAARLARRLDVPWVADYRDLWSVGNEYWVRTRARRSVDRRLERRLLRSAAASVTVSEPLAEAMRRTLGVHTRVVMNGIDRRPPATSTEPVAGPQARADHAAATLTLAHTGYVYPSRRDPGPLLEAVASLGEDAARVHVVFAGEDNGIVRRAVERTGVADSVTLLGQVSAEKSWRIQAEADVLVLLMWNDPRDAGTVTGKIFDYLFARRPILLLGYESGVAANLIRARGAGVVRNDKQAIAEQLRTWLAMKERSGRIPALPASALDGLFRDDQLARYLVLLGEVAGRVAPTR
ncbi:glycosyltransferase [Micromonospora sp. 4G57]|uniref:Glycosyltransferase n=1 Tax=Micromonospora sicca TaxID=2202420 RepID=A0ABU5JKK5_9ACTN|nr:MULTISPECIES: glycosyltransferase [unclassified Micromonospora]MDZ5447620.1 glycosyltransferase [Micromonospora sp. 4G57]MDZ5493148.1 glycosyltransferase [Micromonospora sp. 4G53]